MMGRIPRPFPDIEKFRYKSVFESPATSLDGTARPVDDFMLRAQIKKNPSMKESRTQRKKLQNFLLPLWL